MKYLDSKDNFHLNPVKEVSEKPALAFDQSGKVGYLIAWILGVPVWILLIVFLIKG